MLKPESTIEFYELSFFGDGAEVIVGRHQAGRYVMMEPEGAAIIKEFTKGSTYGTVCEKYAAFDVEDFLLQLRKRGFIHAINSRKIHDPLRKITPLLTRVKQEHVAWLYSKPAYSLYATLILLATLLLISMPGLRPRFDHFFFTESYILLIIISFFASILFVMLHELGHFLAAKSLGVQARFGLVTRYMYLTFITDVSPLYGVERKRRYRVFSAGMLNDMVIGSLLIILLALQLYGVLSLPPWLTRFFQYVVLIEFFGILWQTLLFLRTDLYYTLENFFGIFNLHAKAKQLIRAGFKRHGIDLLDIPWRERPIIAGYTLLYVLGAIVLVWLFLMYTVPITVELFLGAVGNLAAALFLQETAPVVESIVFLGYFMLHQTLYVRSLIKGHKLESNKAFLLTSTLIFLAGNYFLSFFLIILTLKYVPSSTLAYLLVLCVGALLASFVAYLTMRFNEVNRHVVFYTPAILGLLVIFYPTVLYGLITIFLQAQPLSISMSPLITAIAYGAGIIFALAYTLSKWSGQALKAR